MKVIAIQHINEDTILGEQYPLTVFKLRTMWINTSWNFLTEQPAGALVSVCPGEVSCLLTAFGLSTA